MLKLFNISHFIDTGDVSIQMVLLVIETLGIVDSFFRNLYFAVDCRNQTYSLVGDLFDFEPDKVKHYSSHFLWIYFLIPYLHVNHQVVCETFKLVKN